MAVSRSWHFVVLGYVVMAMDEDCGSDDACNSPQFLQIHREVNKEERSIHPWPHARGRTPQQFGTTPEIWQSHVPSWSWTYPEGQYHNLFAGGPAIDSDKNLYQATWKGLYSFDSSGHQRWHYDPPGINNNAATLYDDLILSSTWIGGNAFAVNRTTGTGVWVTNLAKDLGGDVGYPGAYDGVFVVSGQTAHEKPQDAGNKKVFGLNVNTGEKLWEYTVDKPVWNFTPLFPGDNSFVFMDYCGGIYKVNLKTGEEIWKQQFGSGSFSDGGATLGPNGMVYTCSNLLNYTGREGQPGMVRAFYISNGTEVWQTKTEFPCNNYPAIGHIAGVEGLSVVVVPGSLMTAQDLHGQILSLDAYTGKPKWSVKVAPYNGPFNMAAGDAEGFLTRVSELIQPVCLPAHWSAPLITGNGVVLTGRCDGTFHVVYGPDAGYNGTRTPNMTVTEDGLLTEVTDFGSAFLHGALAAAPDMFAFSTCDTLYVFQN